jgi:hypothetical protein
LIGFIQSYIGSYSGLSITIISCLLASFVHSTGLIEDLDNL